MEYKINADLVTQVINVIAGTRNINLNYVELNALFKQLQQLPKIEVEAKAEVTTPGSPADADKKK